MGTEGWRRDEDWLVAGRFTTYLKFKTVIKAKKPDRKPDNDSSLRRLEN
jgi:hypothetical protein